MPAPASGPTARRWRHASPRGPPMRLVPRVAPPAGGSGVCKSVQNRTPILLMFSLALSFLTATGRSGAGEDGLRPQPSKRQS
jgi:hypothetical protein